MSRQARRRQSPWLWSTYCARQGLLEVGVHSAVGEYASALAGGPTDACRAPPRPGLRPSSHCAAAVCCSQSDALPCTFHPPSLHAPHATDIFVQGLPSPGQPPRAQLVPRRRSFHMARRALHRPPAHGHSTPGELFGESAALINLKTAVGKSGRQHQHPHPQLQAGQQQVQRQAAAGGRGGQQGTVLQTPEEEEAEARELQQKIKGLWERCRLPKGLYELYAEGGIEDVEHLSGEGQRGERPS